MRMDSSSQLPNSQYEFSQNSQDLLLYSSGSETQSSRKLFEKYISTVGNSCNILKNTQSVTEKRPQNENVSQNMNSRSNFYQQMQINKAIAKEKDDRELIGIVLQSLKEYKDELKSSISETEDKLLKSSTITAEKVSSMMSNVMQHITQKWEDLVSQVTLKESQEKTISELEKSLLEKDSKIITLKTQLDSVQPLEKLASQISTTLEQQLHKTEDKLSIVLNMFKSYTSSENQEEGLEKVAKSMREQVNTSLKVQFNKSHLKIFEEICQLKQCLLEQKEQLGKLVQGQFAKSQSIQRADRAHMKGPHVYPDENLIKSPENGNTEYMCNRYNSPEGNKSSFHGSIPVDVQHRLHEVHKNYQEEIAMIRKELTDISEGLKPTANCERKNSFKTPNFNSQVNDTKDSAYVPRSRHSSIVSPLNWSAKTLFGRKTKPSPVAKILPQQQQPARCSKQPETTFISPYASVQTEYSHRKCLQSNTNLGVASGAKKATHRNSFYGRNEAQSRTVTPDNKVENSDAQQQNRYMLRNRIGSQDRQKVRNTPMRKINTRKEVQPGRSCIQAKRSQMSVYEFTDSPCRGISGRTPKEKLKVIERNWNMEVRCEPSSLNTSPAVSVSTVLMQGQQATFIPSGKDGMKSIFKKLDDYLNNYQDEAKRCSRGSSKRPYKPHEDHYQMKRLCV